MCQLLNKNAREVETWLGSAPETDKERVRYLVWRAMMERGKENSRVSSRYSTPLSLLNPCPHVSRHLPKQMPPHSWQVSIYFMTVSHWFDAIK
jgi:hypothetical protein